MLADRRRCRWVYETRNETAQVDPRPLAVTPNRTVRVAALGLLLGRVPPSWAAPGSSSTSPMSSTGSEARFARLLLRRSCAWLSGDE
jgi:hypothetical protein